MEALTNALDNLHAMCEHVLAAFDAELAEKGIPTGELPTAAASASSDAAME